MNSLIPLPYYTPVYYHVLLLFVLVTLGHTLFQESGTHSALLYNRVTCFILLAFVVLYIGLRPVSGYFIDMTVYDNDYTRYRNGEAVRSDKDPGFYMFMEYCASIMGRGAFFLLCSAVYVMASFIALRRWFPHYTFLALLIYAGSFSFWAYGTNGIRAGMASALFIAGMAYTDKQWLMLLLFAAAVSFHGSLVLPLSAFAISFLVKNTRVYFALWLLAILLSVTLGAFWETLLSGFETEDERLSLYMTADIARSGFRWDFLLYSAIGIFAGLYFIYRKSFHDPFYARILNTYILSNAFWVLVIRANYTNRFAYLSWFLMPLVIGYPLLKKTMFTHQYARTGVVIFIYYSFTYIMNVLLARQ